MFNQLLSAQSVFSDPDYLPPMLMDFGLETHIFRWRAISKKMPKNHPFFDLHQNRGDHNFDIKTFKRQQKIRLRPSAIYV